MGKIPKEVQAAINKGKKAWKDARKTKPGSNDFSAPRLKKYGSHKVKFDAKYGLTKNTQELYASLIWTIVSGADKGKSHNLYYGIQKADNEEQAQKAMGYLAAAVQTLTGVDTSEDEYSDPTTLIELLDQIHEERPLAMVDLKEDGEYIKCYIKELVEDDDDDEEEEEDSDDEEDEDSEEDEEEDEEEKEEKPKRGAKKAPAKSKTSKSKKVEEDEEEEDDDDEEEEEDEEEAVEPEKGDTVQYKPPRAKKAVTCEVKTVNKRAETCTLQEEGGTKKFPDVPWDALQY